MPQKNRATVGARRRTNKFYFSYYCTLYMAAGMKDKVPYQIPGASSGLLVIITVYIQ